MLQPNLPLSDADIRHFITEGYVRLDQAFPRDLALEAQEILWKEMNLRPDAPQGWKAPVVWLGELSHAPIVQAANTPLLHAAFDQLVGPGKWAPRHSVGTFPVRFPGHEPAGDDGWHVDVSFPGREAAQDPGNYFKWRSNLHSKGRALLMLFLFSDVSENDAPTRLRAGSHLDVARMLRPHGDKGLTALQIADRLGGTGQRKEVLATGEAGTVYLCHPFLVHAAQQHKGTQPRFLAQPGLHPKKPFTLFNRENNYTPVESAIRLGIGLDKAG
ncbi:phytanoyl-CoA dioxygenase family protein [Chitinophaga pollutisoli]|uniref:Phytanoyl-CoA dioxygenase family protein n=1 Tax=Chitinophaga pollutisoli TaxID=3133966 RepID=A0ABZ2YPJ6_9BACT